MSLAASLRIADSLLSHVTSTLLSEKIFMRWFCTRWEHNFKVSSTALSSLTLMCRCESSVDQLPCTCEILSSWVWITAPQPVWEASVWKVVSKVMKLGIEMRVYDCWFDQNFKWCFSSNVIVWCPSLLKYGWNLWRGFNLSFAKLYVWGSKV